MASKNETKAPETSASDSAAAKPEKAKSKARLALESWQNVHAKIEAAREALAALESEESSALGNLVSVLGGRRRFADDEGNVHVIRHSEKRGFHLSEPKSADVAVID